MMTLILSVTLDWPTLAITASPRPPSAPGERQVLYDASAPWSAQS